MYIWRLIYNKTPDGVRLAEREGFEPSVPLRVHTISSRAHSTTLTPLRVVKNRSRVAVKTSFCKVVLHFLHMKTLFALAVGAMVLMGAGCMGRGGVAPVPAPAPAPQCPDVCAAICAGQPEPEIPRNCPMPMCACDTPIPSPVPKPPDEQVFCTQDAKLCPDGSYVARHGPNCEFDPCPGVAR